MRKEGDKVILFRNDLLLGESLSLGRNVVIFRLTAREVNAHFSVQSRGPNYVDIIPRAKVL